MAICRAWVLAFAAVSLALVWILPKLGIRMAERTPIMVRVIISSISVKPFFLRILLL